MRGYAGVGYADNIQRAGVVMKNLHANLTCGWGSSLSAEERGIRAEGGWDAFLA